MKPRKIGDPNVFVQKNNDFMTALVFPETWKGLFGNLKSYDFPLDALPRLQRGMKR